MLEITLFWALFCLPGCCEGFATFSLLALVWRLWSKTPSTFPEARITWMVPLQVSSRNGLEPGTPDKSRGATRRTDGRTSSCSPCTELQLWDLVEAQTSGKPEEAQGTTLDYTNIHFTFVTFLKIKHQFDEKKGLLWVIWVCVCV